MDDEESARPSIGFPLGLSLLLFMLFSMSMLFTCCLHWDKLRSLLGFSSDGDAHVPEADAVHVPQKSASPRISKQNPAQSLPVLMPGDQVPKFIAMACPSEPRRLNIIVELQKSPQ
uniref:Hydroxyproline-rich glycoprotein family protein n=1 Tax=Rhizophora mucronata TaxID=61149 RepID=A0A2P2PJZ3_RHIMU